MLLFIDFSCHLRSGGSQQRGHFVVGRLIEFVVPIPHRSKLVRCEQAHHVVGDRRQVRAVAPVARPSSTITTVRPSSASGDLPAR